MNKKRRNSKQDDSSNNEMNNTEINENFYFEQDYTEHERPLNKSKEKCQKQFYDSEEEVMKLSDEEYDKDEEDQDSIHSDIEGIKDYYLPNEKAWGRKKKSYYSTDYIDGDYSCVSQKDVAHAEFEEQEARNLQKKLVEYIDEADFGFDLILKDSKYHKDNEVIKKDLSKLNKRQKQDLLVKESPEFISLVTDLQNRLTEAKMILGPFLDLVEKVNYEKCFTIDFVKIKYDLLLHYCTNISFYIMLKAKKQVIFSHPVIRRLAQYRQLLSQLEEHQENILEKIKEILKLDKSEQNFHKSIEGLKISIENKKLQKLKKTNILDVNLRIEQKNKLEQIISKKYDNEDNKFQNTTVETEKRAITFQIAKNKGLTSYRKKEQRNPRVKHRNKYRKAKICRKGAIRLVKKEITKYNGEISGIKTSVKKSIKLK